VNNSGSGTITAMQAHHCNTINVSNDNLIEATATKQLHHQCTPLREQYQFGVIRAKVQAAPSSRRLHQPDHSGTIQRPDGVPFAIRGRTTSLNNSGPANLGCMPTPL